MTDVWGRVVVCGVALALALLLAACGAGRRPAAESQEPLAVVDGVDLARYAGTWHEIARYNHRFQDGCGPSQATYTLAADGTVEVLNECLKNDQSGEWRRARGTAKVVPGSNNAKLRVSFFWPFYGDYWIIDLGAAYEYAVVGHPARNYLWILSRTPVMDGADYRGVLERLESQGYDTGRLRVTGRVKEGI